MIILLGGSGYIGQAFGVELNRRNVPFTPLARAEVNYTDFRALLEYLQSRKPSFVINAAGHTGRPNVDACENQRAETLSGNTLLAATVGHACAVAGIQWAHISSGCIYSGGKVRENGRWVVQRDLNTAPLRERYASEPENFRGFNESDEPNFTFRSPPCSFYSGTKALAEEALRSIGGGYIWRLRIPFDEFDNQRNYLSKLLRYPLVYDNINSLSHRGDFAKACLDLWERKAPPGIYNVTNPGAVTAREVVEAIEGTLKPHKTFKYWSGDGEFYRLGAKTPRSNCILDPGKLLAADVEMRPVASALKAALESWQPEDHPRMKNK